MAKVQCPRCLGIVEATPTVAGDAARFGTIDEHEAAPTVAGDAAAERCPASGEFCAFTVAGAGAADATHAQRRRRMRGPR